MGALPEPAVDVRAPAGAGAVLRRGGDYWAREASGPRGAGSEGRGDTPPPHHEGSHDRPSDSYL